MFCLKYKRKNPSHVLLLLFMLCIRVCLHIYLGLSRLCQELDDRFGCCIKSLKKTQVGVLVLAVNSRKK